MEICDANGAHIHDNQVLTTLETKLCMVPRITTDRSIYRVPILLRSVNPKAYTPQLVSIGPFHHGDPNLQPMEIHKLRYLQDFLDRDPQKTIKFYFENLKGYEERARQHYDEHVKLASNEFVEMMLIDGCFVIEFMHRYMSPEPRKNHDFLLTAPSMSPCIKVDMQLLENQLPFFVIQNLFDLLNNNPHGQLWPSSFGRLAFNFFSQNLQLCPGNSTNNHIKHFVDFIRQSCVPSSKSKEPELDQAGVSHNCELRLCLGTEILIVEETSEGGPSTPLEMHAGDGRHASRGNGESYLPPLLVSSPVSLSRLGNSINNQVHILQSCAPSSESKESEIVELIPSATELDQAGVLQSCAPSSESKEPEIVNSQSCAPSSKSKEPEDFGLIPSATELDQAGVKFEKSNNAKCFLDISFHYKKNGVLTICIPAICVEDGTEILFRNLIALDFFNNYEGNYVTGYINLMDQLINTPEDVVLLRRKGIIDNWLGNDDEVSHFVNKLATWTSTGDQLNYAELRKNVNAYCKKRLPKWRAMLMREYFKTPWSTASVVAAIILLFCTILQTFCSVVSVIET